MCPYMMCKCIGNEILMTSLYEKGGRSRSSHFILFNYAWKSRQQEYIYILWEAACYNCRLIWPPSYLFPATSSSWASAGFLKVWPNRALPDAALLTWVPVPWLWFFRLSCRIEQPTEHAKYLLHRLLLPPCFSLLPDPCSYSMHYSLA